MSRTNVALPDPLEPTSAWISPFWMSRSTPFRTSTPAKDFPAPRTTSGAGDPGAAFVLVADCVSLAAVGSVTGHLPTYLVFQQFFEFFDVVDRFVGHVVTGFKFGVVGGEQFLRNFAAVHVFRFRHARRFPERFFVQQFRQL